MTAGPTDGRRVAVVGAGIVGVSCAWQLQARGYQVTLIDRLDPGEACSYGNAGVIATGSCVPQVLPRTWRQVPKWLLSRDGPLAIDPRDLPRTWRWFRAAQRSATPEGVSAAGRALRALHAGAVADHLVQAQAAGCGDLIARRRYLHVYTSEAAYAADSGAWALRREIGIPARDLGPAEIREVEPALTNRFARGVLHDDHGVALDPGGLVKALADDLDRRQGRRLRATVQELTPGAAGGVTLGTDAGSVTADTLVLAAGAWSGELARALGHDFPVTAERGYHVMYSEPGVELRQPVMFADWKFVANSMRDGLRLAGTAEFAAADRPANARRTRMLERLAGACIDGLDRSQPSRWVGARPSLPDSLPVIGRSHLHPDVVFAFGHGHTGLTASATTARIVAALVAGETPPIDIAPFRPDRYPTRSPADSAPGVTSRTRSAPSAG